MSRCRGPALCQLRRAAGLVHGHGGSRRRRPGVISHGAVVAREYGIPAVVGVADATTRLRDGQVVAVDGAAGTVTW
ncbi:PEP-utilizing enzyme [Arthrobacter sp. FW306-05-C]|uniref:PEP-utilizing enzyme n=1 Tax=Arthrobacter sp. FW306-05-C TaxID=2879620 RepID=UPI003017484F